MQRKLYSQFSLSRGRITRKVYGGGSAEGGYNLFYVHVTL